ncbi:hypothetical protein [Paenibacillus sp. HJGM_3]|uniref:hypothetical protein n=1 Tax=Paenibacillus sp. HJGM_3 TaxID=3379816 RepID=UPI00385EF8A6
MSATNATADLDGLCLELQRFIAKAQTNPYERAQPLETYMGELSRILRNHLEIGDSAMSYGPRE